MTNSNKCKAFSVIALMIVFWCCGGCKHKEPEKDIKQLGSSIPNRVFKNNFISLNIPNSWNIEDTGSYAMTLSPNAIYVAVISRQTENTFPTFNIFVFDNFLAAQN